MCFDVKRLYALALGPVLMLMSLVSTGVWASESERSTLNMTAGVTEVGQQIYDLHMLILPRVRRQRQMCIRDSAHTLDLHNYRVVGFWGNVLLNLRPQEIKGCKGIELSRKHRCRNCLDDSPLLHLDCHGRACYQNLD